MLFKFFSRKIIYIILGCVFTIFILASCFSPWAGDDATIVISLGGVSGNRAADFENPRQGNVVLTYKVTLTNGPSTMEPVIVSPGKNEIKITVVPGHWDIAIAAYLKEGVLYARGGKEGVDVKAGQNHVVIKMIKESQTHKEGTVKIEIILSGKDGNIIINNDEGKNRVTISTNPQSNLSSNFTAKVNWSGNSDEIIYTWYLWGFPIKEGKDITIEAKDYNPGKYQLMVMVLKDDKYYSAEIYFTVSEGEE